MLLICCSYIDYLIGWHAYLVLSFGLVQRCFCFTFLATFSILTFSINTCLLVIVTFSINTCLLVMFVTYSLAAECMHVILGHINESSNIYIVVVILTWLIYLLSPLIHVYLWCLWLIFFQPSVCMLFWAI
jgi:hypothetical protein